jgi:hypothetical protein
MTVTDQTVAFPETAVRSTALLRASAKKSFDPFVAVDWAVPLDDRAYHLPPEELPLYGTALYDSLSEPERIAYSRHQAAALCGTGIWLENILIRLLADHAYELYATDPVLRYVLVEVGDECRHSSMFAEYIARAGTPAYRPPPQARRLGRVVRSAYGLASSLVAVLAAEELLDASNRATAHDESLHPVSRAVARVHVVEEARHVAFARTHLKELWPQLSKPSRALAALVAPFTVDVISRAAIHPDVYAALGIEDGYRVARENPVYRRRVARNLERLTEFLTTLGAIPPWTKPIWHKLGLLTPPSERRSRRLPRTTALA